MEVTLYAIVVGLLLSPVYGIGDWLKWQEMKLHTLLPSGSLTGRFGGKASFVLKGACFGILLLLYSTFGWWLVLTFIIMWFLSGWIATMLERKIHANQDNMERIVFAAEQYTRERGTEIAAQIMSQAAPEWWIKLMPPRWQSDLRNRLAVILQPGGPSSIKKT